VRLFGPAVLAADTTTARLADYRPIGRHSQTVFPASIPQPRGCRGVQWWSSRVLSCRSIFIGKQEACSGYTLLMCVRTVPRGTERVMDGGAPWFSPRQETHTHVAYNGGAWGRGVVTQTCVCVCVCACVCDQMVAARYVDTELHDLLRTEKARHKTSSYSRLEKNRHARLGWPSLAPILRSGLVQCCAPPSRPAPTQSRRRRHDGHRLVACPCRCICMCI
jgi:hypothetical protein